MTTFPTNLNGRSLWPRYGGSASDHYNIFFDILSFNSGMNFMYLFFLWFNIRILKFFAYIYTRFNQNLDVKCSMSAKLEAVKQSASYGTVSMRS